MIWESYLVITPWESYLNRYLTLVFEQTSKRREGKVTACGMSSDEIEDLCENYLPYALNPMMSTEEVKEKLHVSDATLNRMVARGDLPHGECKKRGHTRYWKKWDILHFIKSKRK